MPFLLAFLQINVLLQAFISQLKLEGFALMADMVYVTQVRVGCAAPIVMGPCTALVIMGPCAVCVWEKVGQC